MLAGSAADADRAGYLAVHDDGQAALDGGDIVEGDDGVVSFGYPVLEVLARPLEAQRGARFAMGTTPSSPSTMSPPSRAVCPS